MVAELTVAPGLLIAMPQLADPNFARTVVLMVEHQVEGSFGLVINRPAETPVSEVLGAIDVGWQGDPREPTWLGGPVQPETGWILHEHVIGLEDTNTREITPGLFLSSAPEALKLIADTPPKRVRFILGYAGWGPEQLDRELTEGSWVNSDVSSDLIFETSAEGLWEKAVRRIGIDPDSLVPASGIH
ncbi:MAG: YqgE/AlgH family protein [Deltaproteobacteria bacterium]